MLFEGDWREIPNFVSHVENLRKWVQTFGIEQEIDCNEDGCFPTDVSLDLDNYSNKIWTEKSNDHTGVTLLLGIHESWETLGFFVTKRTFDEQREFMDVELLLDFISPCPECALPGQSKGDGCDYCEQDGDLTLSIENLTIAGSEFSFPNGDYFTT